MDLIYSAYNHLLLLSFLTTSRTSLCIFSFFMSHLIHSLRIMQRSAATPLKSACLLVDQQLTTNRSSKNGEHLYSKRWLNIWDQCVLGNNNYFEIKRATAMPGLSISEYP